MEKRYFIVSYVGTDKNNNNITGETDFTSLNGGFLNRKRVKELIEDGNSLCYVVITFIIEISKHDFEYWTAK